MSLSTHTYGYDCRLGLDLTELNLNSEIEVPKLKIQFFYSSPLPIDDPLSVVPSTSGVDSKTMKHTPRPFLAEDNEALEKAWQIVISGDDKILNEDKISVSAYEDTDSLCQSMNHKHDSLQDVEEIGNSAVDSVNYVPQSSEPKITLEGFANITNFDEATQRTPKKSVLTAAIENSDNFLDGKKSDYGNKVADLCKDDSLLKNPGKETSYISKEGKNSSTHRIFLGSQKDDLRPFSKNPCLDSSGATIKTNALFKERENYCVICFPMQYYEEEVEVENYLSDSASIQDPECCPRKIQGDGISQGPISITLPSNTPVYTPQSQVNTIFKSHSMDMNRSNKLLSLGSNQAQTASKSSVLDLDAGSNLSPKSNLTSPSHYVSGRDFGTTGQPFVKLHSRPCTSPEISPKSVNGTEKNNQSDEKLVRNNRKFTENYEVAGTSNMETRNMRAPKLKTQKSAKVYSEVPVGVSKLHLVELPILQMKPLYWSAVHDMASVIRGTWFYKDTMYPVEPAISNQLELGYCKLQPWTQTWKDELESALVVGALGEEKIVHRLWPKEKEGYLRNNPEYPKCRFSSNPNSMKKYLHGEVSVEGSINPETADRNSSEPEKIFKKYSTAQVIYQDSRHAFILKPSLLPSAYFGRKPLQKIQKGITVGIAVVRGFDWKDWDKLHPSKILNAKVEAPTTVARDLEYPKQSICLACRTQQTQIQATDLVLVVHGIGQKLSERVESFNFTHAVNDFRRFVNAELCNSSVKRVLRKDWGGMMVLPVNWRSNLSFEDGGLMKDGDFDRQKLDYSLPDVTQESLPAVRKMISDVMLDIPYYMSNHKPKMIQAVIQEANRVYRLWCKNNRDFEKYGRVHIIAHSLGSAMIMEILSKQPTIIPKLDLLNSVINTQNLEFKTTNCFFVGSPAGFFLLLEQGKLYPRRGLDKPDAENFNDENITGDAGDFGCMVLDNIYNVMHYNDPIAYRLNATVDRKYAESLREAQLPSATTGIFESFGKAIRSITPGITPVQDIPVGQIRRLSSLGRLPSNLEMEVHDFNREEMAEKKFNLLNDNGQIDWYMNSGRGPLEIQYLNMLGAHSSYWNNPDFVRMVVVECGRKPGKSNTLPSMRAVKVTRMGQLNR